MSLKSGDWASGIGLFATDLSFACPSALLRVVQHDHLLINGRCFCFAVGAFLGHLRRLILSACWRRLYISPMD